MWRRMRQTGLCAREIGLFFFFFFFHLILLFLINYRWVGPLSHQLQVGWSFFSFFSCYEECHVPHLYSTRAIAWLVNEGIASHLYMNSKERTSIQGLFHKSSNNPLYIVWWLGSSSVPQVFHNVLVVFISCHTIWTFIACSSACQGCLSKFGSS